MKILRSIRPCLIPRRRICVFAAVIAAMVITWRAPLLAQDVSGEAQSEADLATQGRLSIALPAGWKVAGLNKTPAGTSYKEGMTPDSDPLLANLMLSAAPGDASRSVTLSLVRHRFPVGGIIGGRPVDIDYESAKFGQMVMMQGYTVTTEKVVANSAGTFANRKVSLQVTGKNVAGEERVFCDTAFLVAGRNTHYLFTSWPSSDTAAPAEIDTIIKSITFDPKGVPGTTVTIGGKELNPDDVPDMPDGTPPLPQQMQDLMKDHAGAIVVLHGSNGFGAGFVCSVGGHTSVVTNIHLPADFAGVTITTPQGQHITVADSAMAADQDILKMDTQTAVKPFEILADASTVKVGDTVLIPILAVGGTQMRLEEGKILSIAADRIVIDNDFPPGSSGSPIIHEATGKVLSVASYVIGKNTKGSGDQRVLNEARRICWRLDAVKEWQPVNWQAFNIGARQIVAIRAVTEDVISLANRGWGNFTNGSYNTPDIAADVKHYVDSSQLGRLNTKISAADQKQAQSDLLARLKADISKDITAFDSARPYQYFRDEVDDEEKLRGELYDMFTSQIPQ